MEPMLNRRDLFKGAAVGVGAYWASRALSVEQAAAAEVGLETDLPIVDVPTSIPFDGSSDVTTALGSFLGSVANGSLVRFQPAGRYRIEGTVLVANKQRLYIDGNQAELFATTVGVGTFSQIQNRVHLRFNLCNNITVRALKITGVNAIPGKFNSTYCCQHGLAFFGCKDTMVYGNTVTNVYGDNVYFDWWQPTQVHTERARVIKNICTGNGRQGMAFVDGTDIWIAGNSIANTGQTALDFEADASAQTLGRIHVIDNTFGKTGAVAIAASGAAPVNDVAVVHNRSTQSTLGFTLRSSLFRQSNWLIANNVAPFLQGSSTRIYTLDQMDNVQIYGNDHIEKFDGVWANFCTGLRIVDNKFTGAVRVLRIIQPGEPNYLGPTTDYVAAGNVI